MRRSLLVVSALLVAARFAAGGLYTPDEPCPFQVRPDGTAAPLPLTRFQMLYSDASAGQFPIDPATPGTADWAATDDRSGVRVLAGGVLAQRYAARHPLADRLAGPDLAGYTATLVRLGEHKRAIARLTSETRSRNPNYLLVANLAHANAADTASPGNWDTALTRLADALDCAPPAAPPGTTPEQLTWQRAVDRGPYRLWLRLRKEEAATRPPVAGQVPDAVFETADRRPVRFWAGDEEATKLPADAVAVTQQLALWAPWDVKLLWTLAEVYLAVGDVRAAAKVYEMCADGRKFGGPAVFRDNRAKTLDRLAALPADAPRAVDGDPPLDQPKGVGIFALVDPVTFYVVGGLFAVAAAGLLVLQVRSLGRRWRHRRVG